jgi:hypothetical protein
MQQVNVEVKGGMVALAVEVGDRKVVALLGEDEATEVIWSLQAARGEAASQREQRRQEAP